MPKENVEKLDLKNTLKALYSAPSDPIVVNVPAMNYLTIDGLGDPNTSLAYAAAVEALYGVAYTLKFAIKRSSAPIDYAVMPLEGLWWSDDMQAFVEGDRAKWHWTAMILQPDFVTSAQVEAARAAVRLKRPSPALDLLRFERFAEGRAAQLLHIGPYNTEGKNIARLHAFIGAQGQLSGKHHEIYISDPRRTAPEKLKTIIRQPFNSLRPGLGGRSMLEYDVSASRTDSHGALARAKQAEVILDIDPAGRNDAFNPAELLLASLAACILKGVERAIPMLHFTLTHVDVHIHGVRRDTPPRLEAIQYEILVDTDETDHRLELLHVNIRKYGTIFNTLASALAVSGNIRRRSI